MQFVAFWLIAHKNTAKCFRCFFMTKVETKQIRENLNIIYYMSSLRRKRTFLCYRNKITNYSSESGGVWWQGSTQNMFFLSLLKILQRWRVEEEGVPLLFSRKKIKRKKISVINALFDLDLEKEDDDSCYLMMADRFLRDDPWSP